MGTSVVFQESPKGPRAEMIKAMVEERSASQAAASASATSASQSATSASQSQAAASGAAESASNAASQASAADLARINAESARVSSETARDAANAARTGAENARNAAQAAAMTLGATAYASAAELPVAPAANARGYVYADATAENNGLWFWGAVGPWEKDVLSPASTGALAAEIAEREAAENAALLERLVLKAVQQVLATAGIYPLGENSLGLVNMYTDQHSGLLWGQTADGKVYEAQVIREPLGDNNLDLVHGATDQEGNLLWGQTPDATTYEGEFVRERMPENNLGLVGGYVDQDDNVLMGPTRTGGAIIAGMSIEPLSENNLDLVGPCVIFEGDTLGFGINSRGRIVGEESRYARLRREIIAFIGQSNVIGQGVAITTTPPYDDGAALKFPGGPVGAQAEVINTARLVDLAEDVTETMACGFARRMLGGNPDRGILALGQGWGGMTIEAVGPGGATGTYERVMAQVDVAAALPHGAVCRALVLVNGEADGLNSNPNFHTDQERLRGQFARDVMARTGQVEEPLLMTFQTSSVAGYKGESIALRDTFTTPFLQLKAALENPKIILVGPMYAATYADQSHVVPESMRTILGEKAGQVWRLVFVERMQWLPLHVTNIAADNDAIVIDFRSPLGMALEIDTVAVTDPGHLGFNLLDAGGVAISSVTQTGDHQVTIECSGNVPSGSRLSYAFHNGTNDTSGWNTGARGCIRDTDPTLSLYTGQPMRNWLCAFQHRF